MRPSEIVDKISDLMSGDTELGRAIMFAEYGSDELGAAVTVGVLPAYAEAAKSELVLKFGPTVQVVKASRGGIN